MIPRSGIASGGASTVYKGGPKIDFLCLSPDMATIVRTTSLFVNKGMERVEDVALNVDRCIEYCAILDSEARTQKRLRVILLLSHWTLLCFSRITLMLTATEPLRTRGFHDKPDGHVVYGSARQMPNEMLQDGRLIFLLTLSRLVTGRLHSPVQNSQLRRNSIHQQNRSRNTEQMTLS